MDASNLSPAISGDGSSTLLNVQLNQHYHSMHGAVNESMHVFIDAGLNNVSKSELKIFEMGFGTGLNALLTYKFKGDRIIHYNSVESFPLKPEIYNTLNYSEILDIPASFVNYIHESEWNIELKLDEKFILRKIQGDLKDIIIDNMDIVYFDAFSPNVQPELWTDIVFKRMYDALVPGGILVTYCAKGELKRTLRRSGFIVESLPGPPGKREMVRGHKPLLNII